MHTNVMAQLLELVHRNVVIGEVYTTYEAELARELGASDSDVVDALHGLNGEREIVSSVDEHGKTLIRRLR